MSVIYIRHSKKAHKNGKLPDDTTQDKPYYSLDPDLTEEGEILAREKFFQLFENEFIPNKIITSPYLRTRRTAKIAQDVIYELTRELVEITIDRELSEFLNKQRNYKINNTVFHPETHSHKPINPEYMSVYKKRINKQFKLSQPNILYVTHGLNIQTISTSIGQKIEYPNEVCGIKITNNKISVI